MKSKLAIERDKWIESAAGKKCFDPKTMGLDAEQEEYLKNRLVCAFLAGAEAGARIQVQVVREVLDK